MIVVESILRFQVRIDQPVQFEASAGRLFLIRTGIIIFIDKEPIITVIITAE